MTETLIFLIILALFLALDLITVAARVGFLNTGLARLLSQRDWMRTQIERTLTLTHSLTRLRASLIVTQTILRFLMVGLIFLIVYLQLSDSSILALTPVVFLAAWIIFVLEWIVEGRADRAPEVWALRLTSFARAIVFITSPLVALPLALSGDTQSGREGTGLITEAELKTLVDAGQHDGVLEREERKMIFSIFELGDTLSREIMVPRIDVMALNEFTQFPAAVEALLESGYSRVPVYSQSVDNILGLLYAKDLLRVWREGDQIDSLRDLLRPAYFVPEAKKVDELLAEMQKQRIHMAIVVDEYGGVAGLVTLEDIIEEILGEIQDEYDQGEESPYQELADGEFIFQGRIDLDDFNEIIDFNLPTDEADTLAGFIYSRIGHVPSNGESVQVDNLLLTVDQVSRRRIRKVRTKWIT